MNIITGNTYEEISIYAKNIIVENLRQHQSLLLCAATGGSPTRMYELLAEESVSQPDLFTQIRIIKLDEWGGVPMEYSGTCEHYLQQYVIKPFQIPDERYISFQSNPENPKQECERINNLLIKNGPIDICILGIGMNGHLALNEPDLFLNPHCHVASLSEETLQHPMLPEEDTKPGYGLTLGMADILQSKKIIILISGEKKRKITRLFLSRNITTALPASFLWLHPDVVCLVDKDAV